MSCGDESVAIYRASRSHWLAQPVGSRSKQFRTKQQAAEWAFDWLAEYA